MATDYIAPDDGAIFNKDTGRLAVIRPFGIACYEGSVALGQFHGLHKGVVGTTEEAERWVNGGDAEIMIVYPLKENN